jgi:hypothetical protein
MTRKKIYLELKNSINKNWNTLLQIFEIIN